MFTSKCTEQTLCSYYPISQGINQNDKVSIINPQTQKISGNRFYPRGYKHYIGYIQKPLYGSDLSPQASLLSGLWSCFTV